MLDNALPEVVILRNKLPVFKSVSSLPFCVIDPLNIGRKEEQRGKEMPGTVFRCSDMYRWVLWAQNRIRAELHIEVRWAGWRGEMGSDIIELCTISLNFYSYPVLPRLHCHKAWHCIFTSEQCLSYSNQTTRHPAALLPTAQPTIQLAAFLSFSVITTMQMVTIYNNKIR